HDALAPEDGSEGVVVHAVLGADQHAVGSEIGLDEFREPAVVVRLDREEHHLELQVGRCKVAQVERADRGLHLAVRHLYAQAVRPRRLDLRGPLVYDHGVVARLREVRADAAADGAAAQYCNFPGHLQAPVERPQHESTKNTKVSILNSAKYRIEASRL